MADTRSIEDIKDLGSGKPAPSDVARLYYEAFAKFKSRALWNWREVDTPTITQALTIVESLRVEGNLEARALAFRIESACRAAV